MASLIKLSVVVSTALLLSGACGGERETDTATQRPSPLASPTAARQESPQATPTEQVTVIRATVADGTVNTSSDEVELSVGDRVEIRVTSDRADEVHVHGYDLFEAIGPGETARLRFTADIPGVFEVELEEAGLTLFELRVQ